jgi:alkanesulfonate monooxygenase SsuD/methylene tetrahydromethanopterin reductase-like flavin-dependent oxidoreductase (luciferase family)
MKTIWTQDKAEYHGAFVNFGPMIANPKPVQKPHPPVIVGGSYPYAARRAVQYGGGWYALTGTKYGDEFEFIPKFQDMLANAGRDRSSCQSQFASIPKSSTLSRRIKSGRWHFQQPQVALRARVIEMVDDNHGCSSMRSLALIFNFTAFQRYIEAMLR